MADKGGEAPKIIIDSDWKNQAQAEREKLAEAEAKSQAEAAARGRGAPGEGVGPDGPMPPPDFRTLVDMLAMQALMYLGGVADRRTGQAVFDPEYSRQMIDLLGVLEAKTKGNLAADEAADLASVLNELRTRYVELSRLMAEQALAGKGGIGPGGVVPMGGPIRP